MKKYKIYTKTGDKGTTSLIGGTRVEKNHPRIEAYGNLDELNVFLGAIRDFDIENEIKEQIVEIQKKIMIISAILASDKNNNIKNMAINYTDVEQLENLIDKMEENLPPLSSLIVPGGNPIVSSCHKARVVCRRAERSIVALMQYFYVPIEIITFLNRLSDYLFVLARKISVDEGYIETPWIF